MQGVTEGWFRLGEHRLEAAGSVIIFERLTALQDRNSLE